MVRIGESLHRSSNLEKHYSYLLFTLWSGLQYSHSVYKALTCPSHEHYHNVYLCTQFWMTQRYIIEKWMVQTIGWRWMRFAYKKKISAASKKTNAPCQQNERMMEEWKGERRTNPFSQCKSVTYVMLKGFDVCHFWGWELFITARIYEEPESCITKHNDSPRKK